MGVSQPGVAPETAIADKDRFLAGDAVLESQASISTYHVNNDAPQEGGA